MGDLAQWRTERLADGSVFLGNSAFSGLVRRWFEAPEDPGARAQITAWLGTVQAANQYDRVILLDARGVARLSVPETTQPKAAHLSRDALEVLRSGRAADWDAFQRVVRGETPSYRIEKRYLRKDGSETWVNVNMTVLRDAAGQPVHGEHRNAPRHR